MIWRGWMQLLRPANIVTSIADGLAGVALASMFLHHVLPDMNTMFFIILSSLFLYAGGIVFNDVFDFSIDAVERPERPIPSGKVSLLQAILLGSICSILGVFFAALINPLSFLIATTIVVLCFVYNWKAKHHWFSGPIVMGLCRAFNLLLGISVFPDALTYWYVAFVPLIYISAITNISRGEVYGDNKKAMLVSLALYFLVILTLIFSFMKSQNYAAVIFVLAFSGMILYPLTKAIKTINPMDIRNAVKNGVLALILLNASWVAISGFWLLSLIVLSLLPFSIFLSKKFSVT